MKGKGRLVLDELVLKYGKTIIEAVDAGDYNAATEAHDAICKVLYDSLSANLINGVEFLLYRFYITKSALVH